MSQRHLYVHPRYEFEVWAFLTAAPALNASTRVVVHVRQAPLVAAIDGGSRRVGSSAPLVVSAAMGSYDPDDDDDSSDGSDDDDSDAGGGLWYAWSCSRVRGDDDDDGGDDDAAGAGGCPGLGLGPTRDDDDDDADGDDDDAAAWSLFARGRSNVTVNASTLAARWVDGGRYVFSVAIWRPGRNASAAASATIELSHGAVPQVTVAAPAAAKVNPNDGTYLALVGDVTVDAAGGGAALAMTTWSKLSGDDAALAAGADDDGGDDDADDDDGFGGGGVASHFAVATSCAGGVTTCYTTVLSLGTLAAGSTYTFRLTSTDVTGRAGYATVDVVVNAAPRSGSLRVDPAEVWPRCASAQTSRERCRASGAVSQQLPCERCRASACERCRASGAVPREE